MRLIQTDWMKGTQEGGDEMVKMIEHIWIRKARSETRGSKLVNEI